MISDIWQLQNLTQGTPAQSLAALGLSELKISRRSQGASTASFKKEGQLIDSALLFHRYDRLALLRSGVPWFIGTFYQPGGHGSGARGESVTYELGCPWWYMSRVIFEQLWTTRGYYPRVILGQAIADASWSRLSTIPQIEEILGWAITCGAPFQIGPISGPSPEPPFSERVDILCTEALTMMLKWMGQMSVDFDWTTTLGGVLMPTLHMVSRTAAAPVSFALTDPRFTAIPSIRPMYEQQVSGVQLNFEQKNVVDGSSATQITVDQTPSGPLQIFNALIQTLELGGAQATFQKQRIRVSQLPQSETDTQLIPFWQNNRDDLAGITASNLKVVSGSFSAWLPGVDGADGAPQYLFDGVTPVDYDITDVPSQLIQGQVTKWMTDADSSMKVCRATVQTTLYYDPGSTDDSTESHQNGVDEFGGVGPQYAKYFLVTITATNALSQLYTELTNYTTPETIPTGLSAALYDTLSVLCYEGSLEFQEPECSGLVKLTNVLNLTGSSNPDWAAMRAQILGVDEEIDHGRTTVKIGPPVYLSAESYVELLRASRVAVTSTRMNERATGQESSTPTLDGTGMGPATSGADNPLTPPFGFQLIDASAGHPGRLQVAAGSLGGVWPTGMGPADGPFYLTMSNNPLNYVIAKIGINSDGTFGAATVYTQTTAPTADGSFAYLILGFAGFNGSALTLNQVVQGSQFCIPSISADGTIVFAYFGSLGS